VTSRSPRASASLVVFLAFAGQLAATMHMGLVRHDVCAEHGELVEHSAEHFADARRNAAHADLARAGLHDVRFDRGDGDDDHCLAVTLTQSLAASSPVDLGAHDVRAFVDVVKVEAPVAHETARDVLAVAPKQGPPVLHV
jgi:hypothetical protein